MVGEGGIMNLRNRQQLLGFLAIACLIYLAGDSLVITPLAKSWKARTQRLAELRRSVEHGQSLLDRETSVRGTWDSMRTNALSGQISIAESQLLRAFDRWSQESGVSISGIRPQWKRSADDYMTLECRADASGNLSSLTRFIYLAEKDRLALKVEGLEMVTRDNEAQQLTLSLQVSGLQLNLTP
jgi:hypothetical protein